MSETPPTLEDFIEEQDAVESDRPIADQDDQYAAILMRRLLRIEKIMASNTGVAEAERRAITSWETLVNTPLQERAAYLRSQLEQYGLHVRATQNRKSIQLPHGSIETRQGQPKWQIDHAVFEQWALHTSPDLLRVKYEPDMKAIKEEFEATEDGVVVEKDLGTVVPGITIIPPVTSSIVKPS